MSEVATIDGMIRELTRRIQIAVNCTEPESEYIWNHVGHWFLNKALPLLAIGVDEESDWLRDVAAQSYIHDNGFAKLILSRSNVQEFRLRIHYWPAAVEREPQNIHAHCFDVISNVLFGQLVDREWQTVPAQAPTGQWLTKYTYRSKESDNHYRLHRDGEAKLQLIKETTQMAATAYTLDATILHQSWIEPACATATLFIEDRRSGLRPAAVYSNKAFPEDGIMPSPPLSTEQFRALLREVVGLARCDPALT